MAFARFVGGSPDGSGQWLWSDPADWATGLPAAGRDIKIDYSAASTTPSYVDGQFSYHEMWIAQPVPVVILPHGSLSLSYALIGGGSITVDAGATLSGTDDKSVSLVVAGGAASFSGIVFRNAAPTTVSVSNGGSLQVAGLYAAPVTLSGGSTVSMLNEQAQNPSIHGPASTVTMQGTGNTVAIAGDVVSGSTYTGGLVSGLTSGDFLRLANPVLSAATSVRFTGTASGGQLTAAAGGSTFTMTIGANSLQDGGLSPVVDGTIDLACYATGTLIETPAGERAVESLRAGDRVTLANGGTAPVIWMGRRTLDLRRVPAARPVRVAAGAFAPGLPRRDLRVSPDHAFLVDGVLIPARRLINGRTVIVDHGAARVTYHHVELAIHAVLLAEGVPAESWLDTGNRTMFENAGVTALYPSFDVDPAAIWAAEACAPLAEDGPVLDAARLRLAARADAIDGPRARGCDVVIAGTGTQRARVPAGVESVQLMSSSRRLAHDRRRLGALVTALRLDDVTVCLHDARCGHGFHGVETHGARAVRWTDGAAVFTIGASRHERVIEVDVVALAAQAAGDCAA